LFRLGSVVGEHANRKNKIGNTQYLYFKLIIVL